MGIKNLSSIAIFIANVCICLSMCFSGNNVHASTMRGICAGCPMTVSQDKINESHRRIANKAFNLLKKQNSKIVLGVKAEIDEMQTQVVAGTKFIFKLKWVKSIVQTEHVLTRNKN